MLQVNNIRLFLPTVLETSNSVCQVHPILQCGNCSTQQLHHGIKDPLVHGFVTNGELLVFLGCYLLIVFFCCVSNSGEYWQRYGIPRLIQNTTVIESATVPVTQRRCLYAQSFHLC